MRVDLTDATVIGVNLEYPAQLSVRFEPPRGCGWDSATLYARDGVWQVTDKSGDVTTSGDSEAVNTVRQLVSGQRVIGLSVRKPGRLVVTFKDKTALEINSHGALHPPSLLLDAL